ncbi:MAG TPA: NAD(+) kinase [Gammaproteobacteria bacterium]|nr:NAD(+) kinase [Gammaproteobacteria bacterium]
MTGPAHFTSIGIIGKYGDPGAGEALRRLSTFLRDRQLRVIVDEGSVESGMDAELERGSRADIGRLCDLAVVVGGDGTFLNAARSLVDHDVPLVGINLGHLGFLTDISPDAMLECMAEILDGSYITEERILLRAGIVREGEIISECDAFNDVVVHKWNVARMIPLETYIDGIFVSRLRADGLIVATPTGSTAYALSAGGPILSPQLKTLVLVPVCPHTMSNRPLVVEDDRLIEIVVCENRHDNAQVTCDGQLTFGLMVGDHIRVRKKERPIRLIHPAQHNHYELLRAKLHWAENPLKA